MSGLFVLVVPYGRNKNKIYNNGNKLTKSNLILTNKQKITQSNKLLRQYLDI